MFVPPLFLLEYFILSCCSQRQRPASNYILLPTLSYILSNPSATPEFLSPKIFLWRTIIFLLIFHPSQPSAFSSFLLNMLFNPWTSSLFLLAPTQHEFNLEHSWSDFYLAIQIKIYKCLSNWRYYFICNSGYNLPAVLHLSLSNSLFFYCSFPKELLPLNSVTGKV